MSSISNQHKQIIHIGSQALTELNKLLSKEQYTQYVIICDENTFKHCLPLLISNCPILSHANVFEIEAGEQSKSLHVATQLWQTLADNQADKKCLLINLGGGVVSDLGGFCASVYKRGIDYINVPTSLLGMVDASIGSKTAVDLDGIKNILGSFYKARAVCIDPIFLITLPNREIKNGIAEVIKIALVADKKFWTQLNNLETSVDDDFIRKAVLLKCRIIDKDPFDTGLRKSLNYGHSIGHAIESMSLSFKNSILHGEAVVMGMIIENHLSYQKKFINKQDLNRINQFLVNSFKPMKLSLKSFDALIAFLNHDKKNTAAKYQFSLLDKIGTCKINVEVKPAQIKKALAYYEKLAA